MLSALGNTMNVRQAVPFFMVVNMQASLEFYLGGLGFEIEAKMGAKGNH